VVVAFRSGGASTRRLKVVTLYSDHSSTLVVADSLGLSFPRGGVNVSEVDLAAPIPTLVVGEGSARIVTTLVAGLVAAEMGDRFSCARLRRMHPWGRGISS